MRNKPSVGSDIPFLRRRRVWLLSAAALLAGLIFLGAWLSGRTGRVAAEAPEAEAVLAVQEHMPFQILIPAYMPREFDRSKMEVRISDKGPGNEPMVQLTYRTRREGAVYIREWVPVNPEKEILASSRPIETKWGKGWLLSQGEDLAAIWADVGPLRVSIYTTNLDVLTREQLLAMANSLGPASNRQVFNFVVEQPVIREVPPPPPVEATVNEQGVQEITLVVTPGGYSPLRIAMRQGVPARLTFRQLGQVGCGNELIFPADPANPSALRLADPQDKQVLEFTPQQIGEFEFICGHQMYRGVLTIRE